MKVFSTHEILQETQERLQKVKAERDALKAKLTAIKNAQTTGALIAAIDATPAQCLREIRAEALLAYLATLQPIHPAQIWLEIHLTQYAEQIRQGSTK